MMRLEGVWNDNVLTSEGTVQHERAHDSSIKESRGNIYVVRGLRIVSHSMHIVGECDVVESHSDHNGIEIPSKKGLWTPCPVEYKHGTSKIGDEDRLQLCAEAMCLEEMLCCTVPIGYLFYNTTRRREKVDITDELRDKVRTATKEMWGYQLRNHTPVVKRSRKCNNCSIVELCLAKTASLPKTDEYIRKTIHK